MAGFRFSLEQVLKYRTQLEHQAMVELSRVEQERLREQARRDDYLAQLEAQEAALLQLSVTAISERWLIENYIKGIKADLHICNMRLQNWTLAVDAARAELVKRSLDKKTLEKLKSKQAEDHVLEEKLKEQRQFDETASVRFKPAH